MFWILLGFVGMIVGFRFFVSDLVYSHFVCPGLSWKFYVGAICFILGFVSFLFGEGVFSEVDWVEVADFFKPLESIVCEYCGK